MKNVLRIAAAILSLFVFQAVECRAATLTIQPITIQGWQDSRTAVELWIFADRGFIAADGTPILAGNIQNKIAFKRVTCTVNTTLKTIAIPSFTLTSTTDGLDITTTRYSAMFVTPAGAMIRVYDGFDGFRVPATIASTSGCTPTGGCATWSDLRTYNFIKVTTPDLSTYTKTEIDRKIVTQVASVSGFNGRVGDIVPAANDYTWAQINKATSSLADITTRSAADLSSGTLPAARMPALTGDIATSAGSVSTTLANTAVSAGSYTNANITVDAKGRITAAANGSSGGVSSFNSRTGAVVPTTNDYTWAQVNKATSSLADITTRSASDLSSGTLPDGRFPATLPAASGINLTALNAGNLASGTVADARFPATLPAISGINLTSLNASNLASGTVPDARFPSTLPALSGTNLTNLNATNLISGTVADARLSANVSLLGSSVSLTGEVAGILPLANGGSGADLSATGGANQIVRQNSMGGVFTVSALADVDIPDTITLTNLTQITNRAISDTTGTLAEGRGGTNQTTYTLGDLLYSSASNTLSKLAGNTTSTKKFLRQTGNGSISAAPAWDVLVAGDVPDLSATYQPRDGDLDTWAGKTAPSGTVVGHTDTQTLTNKTISGGSNTISGITEAMLSTSDVTTLDVSTTKHGFVPKAPNSATQYLDGTGNWSTPSGGGGGSVVYSDLTNPAGNLALSMAAFTSIFTWGNATGSAVDMLTVKDTASNSGTGYVLSVNTASSSAAKPLRVAAGGTSNGVEMTTGGSLQAIGSGAIVATTGDSATSFFSTGTLENARLDSDLAALGDNSTNGLWARTGSGTGAARTITGTSNQVSVSNGDGVSGNPTLSLPQSIHTAADVQFGTLTLNNAGLHLLDTNASHDLIIAPGSNITADRTLTVTTGDADRTIDIAGNLTLAAALTTSGANALTLTTTGSTNVTLPTSGTLVNTAVTSLSSLATVGTVTSGTWGTGAVIAGATVTLGSDATGDLYYRNSGGVLTRLGVGSTNQVLTVSGGLPSWQTASGGGATTALDNLASVSINAALIPQTGKDLGAAATGWRNLYLYGQGTFGSHSIKFDGTPTGNRTATFPDNTGTVAELNLAQTWSATQTFTSPKMVTDISDTNGNELFKLTATASAVNEITVANAATGNAPSLVASGGDSNVSLILDAKGTGIIKANQALVSTVVTLTDAATVATDASLSNRFKVTLGGNRTLGNPTNSSDGQQVTWELIQDGTGSRTITLDSNFAFGSDLASITLSTGANKVDYLTCVYNSTAGKWRVVGFIKGY